MSITIQERVHPEFGKCIAFSNPYIELWVTVDIGPRVIRLSIPGGENMFAELPDMEDEICGWKIWGGHRLWTSPEAMPRTYELDNDPVDYEILEDGIIVRNDIDPISGMSKEIEVILQEDSGIVEVTHRVTNRNAWPIELAAWAITVCAPGGKVVFPRNSDDTGYLANQLMAIWPYAKLNDPRFWQGAQYFTLSHDAESGPFKVGLDNKEGWAAYFNHDCAFIKQFIVEEDAKYPDGGMTFETYTNQRFTEVETLSPLTTLRPGETVEHFEMWELLPDMPMPEDDDRELNAFALLTVYSDEEPCDGNCAECEDADTCEDYDDSRD